MRIINFSDGTRMTFEEYRAERLRRAAWWADCGKRTYRVGITLLAWTLIMGWTEGAMAFAVFRSQDAVYGFLILAGSMLTLGIAYHGARNPDRYRQECLKDRQKCLDSLSRVEKAFEEA